MKGRTLGVAPNYTNAFLVSFYVVVLIALVALWAATDYLIALLVATGVHLWLARLQMRRRD